MLRPIRKGEPQRRGGSLFKPLRQVIESINETFKGQLDLERHRGRTPRGVGNGSIPKTSSQTANPGTSGATAWTTPDVSVPGVRGNSGAGLVPAGMIFIPSRRYQSDNRP